MRVRVCPRAVLLIFVNIILKASCKGNGSLTFLIDDTSSMNDDIKQVRASVHRIKDIVLHEKSSLIDNMVLVTLNDPGVHKRIVTRDPNEFKKALDAIKVHNEAKRPHLDCWEPAMKGLLLALENSKNDSYIFVFTDAPAKDYIDSQSVIEMCQKKQTQIVFVLTGTLCGKFTYAPDAIGVFSDIAVACSGLAILVQKNEVNKVFGPIEEIIKGNKTVITTATIPAGVSKNIPFTIDDHTDYVIVYAYGKNVSLKTNERSISTKYILSTNNAKAVKLSNLKPGGHYATVKGATRTSVLIVGRTDFFFSHGFSKSKPKSLTDTSQTVSGDEMVYLSISVTDDQQSVKIVSAQLSDMDGKPIVTNLPLSKISKDFYITDPFIAPSQRFKVAVNGIVIATDKPINRISKIPVTPSPPKIAPKVQGITVIKVYMGQTAQLECKVVRGFPAPKITWLHADMSGSMFTPIDTDSVLVITSVKYKDEGKYKCVAENDKGKDEHVTTLFILDRPKIVSSISTIYKSTEGDALLKIPCIVTGLPKPSITWKLNGGVIIPNAKYSTEDGSLIIRDPKVSDTNFYTCEAKNNVGTASATFKTYIRQKPLVSGVAAKKVRLGSSASIDCTVDKGEPKPTITWQFMDYSGTKFLQISGSDKVLHISRVENKHAGRYKCTAQNAVGVDAHITTLEVQDQPKILSSYSTVYESTEGDAELRIPCVVVGLPKPSITWKLNGHLINRSLKYSVEEGTLIIRDPKVSDSNSYTCEAKNEVGAVNATFRTYIRQKPQVSGVAAKKVRLGSSASIDCTIDKGEPKPTITWHFMDNSGSKFLQISGSDKVLHISRVENKHAGRYKCTVQNSVGVDAHVTTLEVQDQPKILSSYSTVYESTEGDAELRIPCVVAGLPKPRISWKLNGHLINRSMKYSIEDGTLIIRDPKVSDTNSYTCEAKNEVGAVSETFKTYIRQKPQVSGVAAKQVRVGSSASIECTVDKGVPKPSITWQFFDKSSTIFVPIPGSDNVLLISRVENKHAGRYKCVAQNSVGSDEHITTIVVQDLPKILSSISTTYQSTEGDALLRIPCAAAGLPKPSITWKLDGHVINPSAKYSIEDGTLVIRDPKVSDTSSYTCEAKNEVGAVSATFRTDIRQKPQVSGVAAKQVRVGSSASIECTLDKGVPKPSITWQFFDKSSAIFVPIPGSDNVLLISRVENKHAGRYKCVAQNSVGSDEHITTIVVQDPPKILSSISTTYQSTEGDALLRIPCAAAGLPKPSLTWKLDGHVINPSAKYSIEDGTLVIRDPKVSDTNSYTCEAKNEVGAVSATFRTYIRQKPQVSGAAAKQVRVGSSASIECTVNKGKPAPTLSWQFSDNYGSNFLPIPGLDQVLLISRVENKHAGRYKCVARNSVGSDEHITSIVVQDLPKILSSISTTYQSTEGDNLLRIPCAAAGLPKPSITWKLDGHVINPSAKYSIEDGTLVIRDPKVSDSNSYTCEAKNEVGAVSATFRTYIRQTPKVLGVAAKKVRVGSSAIIECTVNKGNPKPTITWQFSDNYGSNFLPLPGSDQVQHISRVENKHAGRYKCVAQNSVGSVEHITTIVVQDLPKILSNSSTTHQSTEGDALLRIPCAAAGLPKPNITWKLDGRVINPSAKYSIEDGTLVIRDPKVSDTNSYTCEAKNEVGAVSTTFRTYIYQKPQVSGVAANQVRVGSSASIECTVNKGKPTPTLSWQFSDNYGSNFVPLPGSDQVQHISRVENKHAGRYKCVAQNSVGSDEHITTIVVQDLPKILSNTSTTHQSTEGDALLRVPCAAAGLPKPSITWKLDGRVINPSAKYSIEDGTLIIRDPKVSDTNSYTCEAKNEVGAVSTTFRTYIYQKPQVSGVADKQVRVGSSASIECTVHKGKPTPTLSWQFSDNYGSIFLAISGSDQVLHISRVENKHAGRYKCVAQNSVGSDEHITTIVVQDLPKILSRISTTYQSTEGDALLRVPCAAAGLPKPSITWKLDGRVINQSAKYSIEDGTLVIRDPKVSDTNSYTCEAKNEVGAVSATFRTYIRQKPQVSGVAAKQVRVGSSASIECTVNKGKPAPTITWQFSDNNGPDFLPIPGSDQVLLISRVENKHAGRYKCVAQNSVGSDEHIITIVVQDPPKILSSISTTYQSTEGDALLRVPCAAAGLPKPSITWKLNGRVINPSPKYSIENGSLIIRGPKVSDTNWYTCEVKNEVGAVSATFRTYIQQAPQLSGGIAKKSRIGLAASIECNVKGEPKPTLTWQFMDSSSSKFIPIPGSDKVLTISKVENKHAGRYKCIAQNDVGTAEHITTLEVQDLPEIVSNVSTIYQSTEGDAFLRIPCAATGLPKPSITWKLDGYVINPSSKYSIEEGTLIIRAPKVSDTNSYICEARNEVGADSAMFKTYIRQAPIISGVPAEKVRIGSPASIKCTVKGEPKPTITWQFMDKLSAKFLPISGSANLLHISRVENKHAGRYKCLAQNIVESAEHVTILEVQDLPQIVSSTSTTYHSIEGDARLRIPCVATGQPKPSITWKLDGHIINPSTMYSIDDDMLVIRDPKVSDTNSYTCEAKNEVGAVSVTFRTYVRQLPKLSGVASKNVRKGSPVDIECTIDQGVPTPTISWQFSEKAASEFVPIGGSENTLRITKAENKHAGRYKCVAQNKVGSDEHVTTLIVEYLPGITINSTTVDGIVGDLALRIPCNVVGVPQPVITWKIDGTKITPNEKYFIEDGALVIAKPAKNDSSSYTCEAKNSIGSVSATFEATVRNHPKSFGTEHYVYVRQGETRNLECEAYNNSESQSIQWFETKEGLQYLNSLLSTTSSPAELDLLETTTSNSDKDSSTMPRITTQNTGNKEAYFQIVNASSSKHHGNYTCRVNDRHGNTQTHTYVVEVGIAPKFISNDNYISNWRGDIKDITQICDIISDAKPQPVIQWKFNGKKLTDLNSAGAGHYTCNVSNVHGSVLKQFDVKSSACLITRDLRDAQYMPLVLNDDGLWHKLETTDYYMIVDQAVKIILSCPSQKETSNSFKNFPKKNTLEAICTEDSFIVDDKTYKLSDLQCTNRIQPSIFRKKVKCSTETSELVRVGYNVPGFLEAYEVCFDHKVNMPLYTRIIMTDTNNNGLSAGYNWYTYPGIGYKQNERGFTCKDASSSCCYSKAQLVNAIDFNDGPAKRSTFINPLNVIPVWVPCDNYYKNSKSPWEYMNDKVRSLLPMYTEIVVWSGTHTLQEKNGAFIPRYLWKVVRLLDAEVMAIVYVNDPEPTESDIKCKRPDICDNYDDWFVGDDSIYCCSLPDFKKSFDFHETDFEESLDAALDSMKNIPDPTSS